MTVDCKVGIPIELTIASNLSTLVGNQRRLLPWELLRAEGPTNVPPIGRAHSVSEQAPRSAQVVPNGRNCLQVAVSPMVLKKSTRPCPEDEESPMSGIPIDLRRRRDDLAAQAVSGPVGHIGSRRPDSVRRTTTIDMTWLGGRDDQLRLDGRARDVHTISPTSSPTILDEVCLSVGVGTGRTIEEIGASPAAPFLADLVGTTAGRAFRPRLLQLAAEVQQGQLLYALLDDVPGCVLISPFAWQPWAKVYPDQYANRHRPNVEGICTGFRPGSSGLAEHARLEPIRRTQPVSSLVSPSDPTGWHHVSEPTGVSIRRARWIDVWRRGGLAEVSAGFQDSATHPDGGRIAVHEYVIDALVDTKDHRLLELTPEPRVLPFIECPDAAPISKLIVGQPLTDLRTLIPQMLSGISGCTHLNDALRTLADVPTLLQYLLG